MQITPFSQQIERLNTIADNLNKQVFVWVNPISLHIEAFIDVLDYKPPNPNINDFVDFTGRDITDYINEKWHSITVDNRFDIVRAGQIFESIRNTHLNFSSKYPTWYWVNKK